MTKLVVFDLDDTLAPTGAGVSEEALALLKQLEAMDRSIAICSGKPTYYLCGFARQLGLRKPVLIGENGAVIQIGIDLPPKQYSVLPCSEGAKRSITLLRERIQEALPNIWYQPNTVALTPFPEKPEEFDTISRILEESKEELRDIKVFRHFDSFDIVPANLDKKAGLEFAGKLLNILPEEIIAVGNGTNDYPMFEAAGYALGVQVPDGDRVAKNFETVEAALAHILERLRKERQ